MKKIIVTIATIVITTILSAIVVYAKDGQVTTNNLNFRDGASTSANVIGKLSDGTKVNIVSEDVNWVKIEYNGTTGYISKDYVKETTSTNSTSSSANTTSASNTNSTSTNTTSSNATASSSQNTASASSTVTSQNTASTNSSASQNTTSTSSTSNASTVGSGVVDTGATIKTGKTTKESTVYVLPLINSTKLGTIASGKDLVIISVNGNWANVQSDSMYGWILIANIDSLQTKNEEVTTANTTATNEVVEEDADNELANVAKNATANTTSSETTNTTSSETNTASTSKDSTNTTSENTTTSSDSKDSTSYPVTMYVSASSVNVRKSASKTADVISGLSNGQSVKVTGTEGNWYKVSTGDGDGYVMKDFLSKTK